MSFLLFFFIIFILKGFLLETLLAAVTGMQSNSSFMLIHLNYMSCVEREAIIIIEAPLLFLQRRQTNRKLHDA